MKTLDFHFSNKGKLELQDHLVSKERFTLKLDKSIGIYKTFPIPPQKDIWCYYPIDNYISHKDVAHTLFDKIYLSVKKYSLKRKFLLASFHHPQTSKILDFGAGNGDFARYASDKGWKSYVYEPSNDAQHTINRKSLCVVNDLSLVDDCFFDVITLWHSLEHVLDLETCLCEIKRVLKPDGTIIVAVPNFKSFDAAYYGKFWAAYDVPRHIWHFSQKAVDHVFETFGMKIIDIKPLYFDAFYVSILSEKYKKSSFSFLKGSFIGLISNVKALFSKEYSSLIYVIRKH